MVQAQKTQISAVDQLSFLNACESYLRYYANGNSTTSRGKRRDLSCFISFLTNFSTYSKPEKLMLSDWTPGSVTAFMRDLSRQGEATATIARRLATLKHFGRMLEEQIPQFNNPAKSAKTPKSDNLLALKISQVDLERISAVANERLNQKNSFSRTRNKMLFLLLVETGLRPEEVRLLRRDQIDQDLEWIHSIRTKSGNFRHVPLSAAIRPELEAYLLARRKQLKRFFKPLSQIHEQSTALFLSTYRANPEDPESFFMGAKSVWRAINELSEKVQIHPHLLRHVHAAQLIEKGADLESAAKQLGHTDIRLTKKYLNK